MSRVRAALFVCGAALFVGLLIRLDPRVVIGDLVGLSWLLPVFILFPACVVTTLDALGWRFAFRRDRVPFGRLLAARLAGETFNLTTPTASVGGEVVKAWLVRPYAPLAESFPSLIVAQTTHTVAQVFFLTLSLVVAWLTLPRGSAVLTAMRWFLLVEVIGVGGFVAVQLLGPIGGADRILRRVGLLGAHRHVSTLRRVDDTLSHFYRREPRRLILSIACHFAGWTLGILETYIILRGLGVRVSLAGATVIEAFGTGIGFAAFLIPARLGAVEAGNVLLFAALGLDWGAGFTLTLVQRVRELAWAGIGLLAVLALRTSGPLPALKSES